jgi:hypothetical protein
MIFWRRREPLHERLAREAGLPLEREPRYETVAPPAMPEVGIHGLHRPRIWDAVVTAEAELPGERLSFVALPDELLVEEGEDGDVSPLAEAVEEEVEPPYRAEAVRRDGTTWAVGARRIVVRELTGAPGDELELTSREGETTLLIDGERSFGTVRELERLRESDYVVRASRLDGDLFELRVDAL